MTFKELKLNETLLEGLDAMGFKKATPIQEKAIPIILDGKDLIACAQTGTGKTAAFLLPVLHLLSGRDSKSIGALILVPTRELAIQIDQQLEGLSYYTGISFSSIYGGRDKVAFNQEKQALTLGADIIVATPGRLIMHLNLGYAIFDGLQTLILDEADRMLDMGFINDLKRIIGFLPDKRQTLMFSATMPPKVDKLARQILHEPEKIKLRVSTPAEGILQGVYHVLEEQKIPLLEYILRKTRKTEGIILIFASTKANVKKIAKSLKASGFGAEEIHSDLDQSERSEVLRRFQNKKISILVATDILSRGIDVKGISIVINFNVPPDGEDYIHRIGRTARANTQGVALTFVNRKDKRRMKNIEHLVKKRIPVSPLPAELKSKRLSMHK